MPVCNGLVVGAGSQFGSLSASGVSGTPRLGDSNIQCTAPFMA
jgi:hypothetical protein